MQMDGRDLNEIGTRDNRKRFLWNRKGISVDCDFCMGNRSNGGKDIFCIVLNTCQNGADSYQCCGTIEISRESASSEALFVL